MSQDNPFERGTTEHVTQEIVNEQWRRQAAKPRQPTQIPKGLGEWVAALGCCFFLFGVLWSMSAVTLIGHVILIVGTTLLGMAIAVVGYAIIKGPAFLVALMGRAWRDNVLSRSVLVGAAVGVAMGAWLGISAGELFRGIIRLGVLGTVLGLVVGAVLLMRERARIKRVS